MIRVLTILMLFTILISISSANIINVSEGILTIQAGIDSASAGDTVLVAEGTYEENINFKGKAIIVASEFIMDPDTSHISKTIIDGSKPSNPDSASVVYFLSGEDTNSVLCGFTITGGKGTRGYYHRGGGIYMHTGGKISHNKIENNNIDSNDKAIGAGIAVNALSKTVNVIINDNIIQYNSLISRHNNWGGGIALDFRDYMGGYCRINNNVISHNVQNPKEESRDVLGGGIAIRLNLPTIGDVIIFDNIITDNRLNNPYPETIGAGIFIKYLEPSENFIDNNPCPYIYNNIIASNYTDGMGAGIGIFTEGTNYSKYSTISPQPAIINNTIVHNSAKDGCGIFSFDSYPLLMNNIIWNDLSIPESGEIYNEDIYQWYGLTEKKNDGHIFLYNSIVQDINWSDVSKACYNFDPLLINESYQLSEESPAVGTGKKSITIEGTEYQAPNLDLNGSVRPNPIDALVDMGAIESTYQQSLKIFPKAINIDKSYVQRGKDSIHFTADIFNPSSQDIDVFGIINKVNKVMVDSVELFDDGNHGDGQVGDGLFGGDIDVNFFWGENIFCISTGIKDNENEKYLEFTDPKRFTTLGPIVFVGYIKDFEFQNFMGIYPLLKNLGSVTTATNVTIELSSRDENIASVETFSEKLAIDIPPGETVKSPQQFTLEIADSPDTLFFDAKIYSNGHHFWTDSSSMHTSVSPTNQTLPIRFYLAQNYPNPFNPSTVISWQLAVGSEADLSIYNVLGQKVVTLVSGKQKAGPHSVKWDAGRMASGIYYYRLEAGNFIDTKKLIVLK